jgi:hypothetical protein
MSCELLHRLLLDERGPLLLERVPAPPPWFGQRGQSPGRESGPPPLRRRRPVPGLPRMGRRARHCVVPRLPRLALTGGTGPAPLRLKERWKAARPVAYRRRLHEAGTPFRPHGRPRPPSPYQSCFDSNERSDLRGDGWPWTFLLCIGTRKTRQRQRDGASGRGHAAPRRTPELSS